MCAKEVPKRTDRAPLPQKYLECVCRCVSVCRVCLFVVCVCTDTSRTLCVLCGQAAAEQEGDALRVVACWVPAAVLQLAGPSRAVHPLGQTPASPPKVVLSAGLLCIPRTCLATLLHVHGALMWSDISGTL